jgi:drug/metabolite transporter (DMT)-like permease
MRMNRTVWLGLFAMFLGASWISQQAVAQQQIEGQILGAGASIANATVTLWAATPDAPARHVGKVMRVIGGDPS